MVGCFMLLCMVTVSLPIGVLGGNFSNLWSRYAELRDAVDRSKEAWATRAQLRGLAAKQCAAADELMGTANQLKVRRGKGRGPGLGRRRSVDVLTSVKGGMPSFG